MENNFEYFAFISYKREDEKWAKWLQEKLEHYKLPSVIRKEFPRLPEQIYPVFRDKTDLGAGLLTNNLQSELEKSQFIIVICSPSSAHSEWVGTEIKTFVELGRQERIIPFIVAGAPNSANPEEECFHPIIKESVPETLGINVSEIGKEQAFVKVAAKILDLHFDALWNRYQREQRKHSVITALGTFALFVTLQFTGVIFFLFAMKPRFLEGKKRMLFVAGYIGGLICLFLVAALLCINAFEPDPDAEKTLLVITLITLLVVILNFAGWQKNNALLTLIAGIVYTASLAGIPLAVLCFIAYNKLEKPRFFEGKKPLLFTAGCIGVIYFASLLWVLFASANDNGGTLSFVYMLIALLLGVILNFAGWQKNNALLTLIAGIVYIASLIGIPSAVLCFIGRAQLKKQSAECVAKIDTAPVVPPEPV